MRWPQVRIAQTAVWPGAMLLINKKAFDAVGGCRDGCTFFEGHLGLRLMGASYLSLHVECPPWLHQPSRCFSDTTSRRQPVDHRDTDALFLEDFGAPVRGVLEHVKDKMIPKQWQDAVDSELSLVQLALPDRKWEEWL
jgi:hypothetical protein